MNGRDPFHLKLLPGGNEKSLSLPAAEILTDVVTVAPDFLGTPDG